MSSSLLRRLLLAVGFATVATFFPSPRTRAQIAGDNTLGTQVNGNLTAPCTGTCVITNGSTRGGNLFHSFRQFSLPNRDLARFVNDSSIQNVIVRVTGVGQPFLSTINGTIQTSNPANFFLLNPNGIIWGANAQLDTRGSFVASASDRFIFPDGSEFSTTSSQAPPLLTVNLIPGLQHGKPLGNITHTGQMAVLPGKTLRLFGNVVTSSGSLVAPGGNVEVLGDRVALLDNAQIDVSAPGGGGTVLIGGDFQGQGTVLNAKRTFVSPDATINANAIAVGNGGTVIVWSDEATRFYGKVSAKGGETSGNGGFVEVSGREFLDFQGDVNTLAPNGLPGTLLLDPTNITVVAGANNPPDLAANDQFADPGVNNTINNGTINAATSNVILQATNDIVFNANVLMNNPGVGLIAQAGNNIEVNALISMLRGEVQLIAGNNITLTDPIGSVSTDGANATLQAGNRIVLTNGATVDATAIFSPTNSGNIQIQSKSLQLTGSSQILTEAPSAGLNAGNLTINATEFVDVAGTDGFITRSLLSTAEIIGANGNAGNLTINTGRLTVRDGALVRTSASGSGQGGTLTINASSSVEVLGTSGLPVFFRSGLSTFGVDGTSGNLIINTSDLNVQDGAALSATSFGSARGGYILINASNSVNLFGTSSRGDISNITARALGSGDGGTIDILTGQLTLQDGAIMTTATSQTGQAGQISVQARESIAVKDQSQILSTVAASAIGNGGTVDLQTRSLLITDESSVSTSTFGIGKAGSVNVQATDTVRLANSSGILTQVNEGAFGDGGTLTVTTGRLVIENGSVIAAGSLGDGQGGTLNINASESVEVSGGQQPSGISTDTTGTLAAGNLTISTRQLSIRDKASISTSTFGAGNAGRLTINASESVAVRGNAVISTSVDAGATGSGGALRINTGQLTVQNGAQIGSGTFGAGRGGTLNINATDSITLTGSGSGLFTQTQGNGDASALTIQTDKLIIQDGAQVSAGTFGQGQAGALTVYASNSIQLSGQNSLLVTQTDGVGNAGNMELVTETLIIQEQGGISLGSQGTGQAGSLFVKANTVQINDRASIKAETRSGNGGNITLNVQDLLLMRRGSQISTSAGTAQQGGNGGNITINAPNGFIVGVKGENSDITANAFTGSGGRVDITAQGIFGLEFRPQLTRFSDITASSTFGLNGVVTLNTPNVDPSRGLSQLPQSLIDTNRILANSCIVRDRASGGVFIVTGTGGLPEQPGTMQPTFPTGTVRGLEEAEGRSQEAEVRSQESEVRSGAIAEAQGFYQLPDGQIILSWECR